jgi:hypothetical protein
MNQGSDFCSAIKHVVLVASSSRGGSSVSMEMLRHSRSLLHFRGEINPFLAAANLIHPHSGTDSDALGAEHVSVAARTAIGQAMARDAGQPGSWPTDHDGVQALAEATLWRLKLQWPDHAHTPKEIHDAVSRACAEVTPGEQATPSSIQAFQLALAAEIPRMNPWFYDLDPSAIRSAMPDLIVPTGAPGPRVIEEPPFVLHQPWVPATPDQIAAMPLMIKTPSNAYRLPFLRELFPNARVQILHLTRNPAAAINGLVDGWRFRGFHAHKLAIPHTIAGAPETDWWKYDLPPGWRDWTDRSLVEVAGFQWRSAHAHIMAERGEDALQVRFEDLVGPERHASFSRIFDWMNAPLDAPMAKVIETGLPPVMATERPRQRRWFARADLLEPVLMDADVARITQALGCGDRSAWV